MIACQVGRSVHYACQIHHNKLYLLKHYHLPPHKEYTWHGQYSLVDNEIVLNDVCIYLTAQSLGTVTLLDLCQHVNGILLPVLGIKTMISELTAQQWLKFRLGYECKEAKKGVYIDGHSCPDMIKEREAYSDQIKKYEQYVTYNLQCNLLIKSDL